MRIPTIHLNGTSGAQLVADWRAIAKASTTLTLLLESTPVNARDYYPQGDGAFAEAQADMIQLLHAARSIEREAKEVFEALFDELEKRNRKPGVIQVEQSEKKTIGFWLDDEGNLR
jgi:hypothetical protein